MIEWKKYTIEEISKRITSGGTPLTSKMEYYKNGTIPWLKTTEVNKEIIREIDTYITEEGLKNSSAKLIPANSIIVAMYGDGGTAGKVALTKIPLCTNQACCNLVIDEKKADYGFIFYFLKVNYENLVNLKSGGSQQNLNALTIRRFPVQLPPLPIQWRIASILSAYDEFIEVNNQRKKLLEETTRELYKEWFVRMRFPGHKEAKFVKGVPEGWELKKLKEFCTFKYGTMPKQNLIRETGFPIFSGYGIVGYYEKYMFEEKTLIVVARGVGGTGDIKLTPEKCWLTNLAIAIFPNNVHLFKYFLYYTLFAIDLRYLDSGSAQSQITIADIGNLKLLIPGIKIQKRFEEFVIPIDNQIDYLNRQNTQLRQIRDRFLPRLISGKLEVKADNKNKTTE